VVENKVALNEKESRVVVNKVALNEKVS